MRILVVGAAGRTGRLVVAQGVARGHEITAFARNPDGLGPVPGVQAVFAGDATRIADLGPAVRGQEAVVSAIGTSAIAQALIEAMTEAGVRRIAMTSSRSVVATRPRPVVSLVWAKFRAVYADLARAEGMLQASGLDWTIVRGAMLSDRPGAGRVHIDHEPNATGGDWRLSRADYAMALLDAVTDPTNIRRALGVGGPRD